MFLRTLDNKLTNQIFYSFRNFPKTALSFSATKRLSSEDLIQIALSNVKVKKPGDWTRVKEFVFAHESNRSQFYGAHNIDGIIMGTLGRIERLDLAQSYLKYLQSELTKPNLATLGRYLRLLYDSAKDKITEAQEQEILSICMEIQRNNSILDSRTLENMALPLSLTKEWQKCFNIIQEIKRTSSVSTTVYSAVAASAFINNEEDLAWNLLNEVLSLDKLPLSVAFLSYIEVLKKQKRKVDLVKLLTFFKESEMLCHEEVVNGILKDFNVGQKTTIKFSGECQNCLSKLKKLELTDAEFSELKEVFFKNAIIGKDLFIKTNPDEMRKFQQFVNSMEQYDVVLDGLNIAYSTGVQKGPEVFSRKLCSVISHFRQQNKSVLMLGRVHMTRWPKNNWHYIKKNSSIFLTQNISQDDPYLLYCALHSGKNTIIVSRDLMRGHKFLLKERKYKILFNRWLSQRQYFLSYVDDNGKASFRIPPHFSVMTQKIDGIWHVPYIPEGNGTLNESYHKTWLCFGRGFGSN
ncbi:unnamed protein product [Ceutorhynchus assimilis]|uniref:Mitochondrial ribonuclease P catalytic subunit n=1 Tax=Ceutorhynchus assimilis TaxID=467358 RepID=A0A9N9MW48_9CUCU|nr:unnamed protein product [Ceutorhynchus assimilis]